MNIGILTAGGDCPGLNAAIRGVARAAMVEHGMKVYGISSGFLGLIEKDYFEMNEGHLSGILSTGGTILGTSRFKPFKKSNNDQKEARNHPEQIKETYEELGLDCLVCIGGNGTQKTANKLAKEGLNVIGVPKTIDNDVWGTDITFGFDSAVYVASTAIDRLHTTANSHNRIMVIEVMGHHAGWIALHSGIAGGGDMILLPEIEFSKEKIINSLQSRVAQRKNYSIIVVAEGIDMGGKRGAGHAVAKLINENIGHESRETVLGYLQRGGTPTPTDRIIATQYGTHAAKIISERKFGNMVALINNKLTEVPLDEVAGKLRLVTPEAPLVSQARSLGISFGDD